MRAWLFALALLSSGPGACSSDRIEVASTGGSDQNRGPLLQAVATLRATGHAVPAFAGFGATVLALRPGMDETVADEAELLVVTEALAVVRGAATRGESLDAQIVAVWPMGLAPPIEAPVPGVPASDAWAAWMPAAAEVAGAYLVRICGGVLALECKDVVPEGQRAVVGALAVERYTDRARRAVITCLTCNEPRWHDAVAGWEELTRVATATVSEARSAHAPSRWPEAGAAAVDVPAAAPSVRVVHLRPDERVERVRYALADARTAGASSIALLARERAYPYPLRAYLLATSVTRLPVRDGEPVQMLTRALDAQAHAPR